MGIKSVVQAPRPGLEGEKKVKNSVLNPFIMDWSQYFLKRPRCKRRPGRMFVNCVHCEKDNTILSKLCWWKVWAVWVSRLAEGHTDLVLKNFDFEVCWHMLIWLGGAVIAEMVNSKGCMCPRGIVACDQVTICHSQKFIHPYFDGRMKMKKCKSNLFLVHELTTHSATPPIWLNLTGSELYVMTKCDISLLMKCLYVILKCEQMHSGVPVQLYDFKLHTSWLRDSDLDAVD